MVINPTSANMSSQPLPDISSLVQRFNNLSLMSQETSYPSPTASERLAILAVDTAVVAEVTFDMRRTDTPPPAFPEEPEYTNPTEPPPDFNIDDYLRLSPSLVSVHGPSRPPTPLTIMTAAMEASQEENNEPLPIPPRLGEHEYYAAQQTHPSLSDNPRDPRNLVAGVTEQQRESMFRSVNGLRDAILSLMRREDEEELAVPPLTTPSIAPEMLTHRGRTSPSTESSITSSAPSHLSILVDGENDNDTHPGEDWIRFIPEIHRTGTLIPINEANPDERVLARYIRFHVDQITGEPTISGTMGRGCPIYGDTLAAAPVADPAPTNYRDHRYFEMFEEQSMICGPVNRAFKVRRFRRLWCLRRCDPIQGTNSTVSSIGSYSHGG